MGATVRLPSIMLGFLALVAIVTISPQAFAQENQAGQGQQGGIPLGSSYSAPANATAPSAPTTPAPSSQAPQYGSQVPSATMAGSGQQGGIPLGSSYGSNPVPPPATPDASTMGWSAAIAIIGVMSGIGVWTATRKH